MAIEAYSVDFEKANYHAPIPRGFDSSEVYQARESEIRDNMVRYVGEYRLCVKFDEFYYRIEKDEETGESYFASKERGPIRNIYRNAIYDRESKGASVRREVAECLGFEKLEQSLLEAPDGTMAVWVSPPGKKSEGYGNYSFTFLAQVEDGERGRNIRMIPYRNEFSLQEHNLYLSKLTKENVQFTKDTQFLSSPFIIEKSELIQTPEDLLLEIGETEQFNDDWRGELEDVLQPYIDWFLYLVRENAPGEELVAVRNIIENLTIAYKKDKNLVIKEMRNNEEVRIIGNFRPRRDFVEKWSYEPPKVAGSCPIPDGNVSTPMEFQNALGKLSEEDEYGPLTFDCPEKKCGKENKRPRGKLLKKCQHCKSDKVAC